MVFSLQNISKNLFSNKYLTIVLILLIFLGISIYVYYTYVLPKLDKKYVDNKEYVEDADDKNKKKVADLYYFYTTWCPYCKKARPEWDAIKDQHKEKNINGWSINFIEIDCEEQDEVAGKFGVDEYPTIKLIRGNQIVEYDAKPNRDTINEFLNKMLK